MSAFFLDEVALSGFESLMTIVKKGTYPMIRVCSFFGVLEGITLLRIALLDDRT